jgi:hypothetical protein
MKLQASLLALAVTVMACWTPPEPPKTVVLDPPLSFVQSGRWEGDRLTLLDMTPGTVPHRHAYVQGQEVAVGAAPMTKAFTSTGRYIVERSNCRYATNQPDDGMTAYWLPEGYNCLQFGALGKEHIVIIAEHGMDKTTPRYELIAARMAPGGGEMEPMRLRVLSPEHAWLYRLYPYIAAGDTKTYVLETSERAMHLDKIEVFSGGAVVGKQESVSLGISTPDAGKALAKAPIADLFKVANLSSVPAGLYHDSDGLYVLIREYKDSFFNNATTGKNGRDGVTHDLYRLYPEKDAMHLAYYLSERSPGEYVVAIPGETWAFLAHPPSISLNGKPHLRQMLLVDRRNFKK